MSYVTHYIFLLYYLHYYVLCIGICVLCKMTIKLKLLNKLNIIYYVYGIYRELRDRTCSLHPELSSLSTCVFADEQLSPSECPQPA